MRRYIIHNGSPRLSGIPENMLIGVDAPWTFWEMSAASDAEIVRREPGRLVLIQAQRHVRSILLKPD
ncbi:hypothetical protein [Shinella sp. G-2]|uniref:hypothetical protein n=1 Tax=Shinella sp. G-2 TaxID=3133141 RepID=UPI003CFFF493